MPQFVIEREMPGVGSARRRTTSRPLADVVLGAARPRTADPVGPLLCHRQQDLLRLPRAQRGNDPRARAARRLSGQQDFAGADDDRPDDRRIARARRWGSAAMAHVFISYARPDEPLASRIADALREEGLRGLARRPASGAPRLCRGHRGAAQWRRAVVVLWSAEAAKSHWVRAEADTAPRRADAGPGQRSTEPCRRCRSTRSSAPTSTAGTGSGRRPGWRKLLASVSELAGIAGRPASSRGVASRDVSICVLPFQNMSGDPEQEYFSDGISEDITTDLSQVSALEVIARNTAFTFKGQSVNVCEVARKLGVTPRPRRQRSQGRRPGADQRPADRRRHRRACLGRALRPRPHRHLHDPGRDFEGDRRAR